MYIIDIYDMSSFISSEALIKLMVMKLVELKDRGEVEYARLCIKLYGMKSEKLSGADGSRYFALVVDDKICAVAWIHKPHIFEPIFKKFNLDQGNSYFLRRIATCCPGDYSVTLLKLLIEKLRSEGKELLVTLGLTDHSNALYKEAGFQCIGYTPRTLHPVFIKRLKQ